MCIFKNNSNQQLAEGLFRSAMGIFMLMAGIGKLMGGLEIFVDKMTPGFAESFLPLSLVAGFFYLVPFLELIIGVWLLVGWKRDMALWGTGVLLIVFIFGHLVMGDMNLANLFIYLFVTGVALTLPQCSCCCGKCKK